MARAHGFAAQPGTKTDDPTGREAAKEAGRLKRTPRGREVCRARDHSRGSGRQTRGGGRWVLGRASGSARSGRLLRPRSRRGAPARGQLKLRGRPRQRNARSRAARPARPRAGNQRGRSGTRGPPPPRPPAPQRASREGVPRRAPGSHSTPLQRAPGPATAHSPRRSSPGPKATLRGLPDDRQDFSVRTRNA